MKSLAQLSAIKEKVLKDAELKMKNGGTKIVVGMATCGIAAGAKPVFEKLQEEVKSQNLDNVTVSQTGCIGMCGVEPIIEVFKEGQDRVTYINVNPDMIPQIISEHIVNGNPVSEYAIGNAEK